MKNTEICSSEYIKSEVLYRKMLHKINMLEHQIFEVKKMTNIFWDIRLKKPHLAKWISGGDSMWWKTAADDISERWKEIDETKDEIDWVIGSMFASVEREEKQRPKKQKKYDSKIKNNKKRTQQISRKDTGLKVNFFPYV